VALAFAWIPFALAAWAVAGDPDHLRWLVAATLLFSLAHQPLTLWLVYGDAAQRRAHRSVFVWAPVVATAAVAVGMSVRPEAVAIVAGAWNVAHTLRQRYGLCRMYGRASGVDGAGDHRLLWTWLLGAVVVVLARVDLADTARALGLGRRNTVAIEFLGAGRGLAVVALPAVLIAVGAVTATWLRDERRRPVHSTARAVYVASTLSLLAVLAVAPVVGLVAYVGSHAAEYLLVVRWRMDRAAQRTADGDHVGALARRIGGATTVGVYLVGVVALIGGLRLVGGGRVAATALLTLGALHLFYDGFIWHSSRATRTEAA
jgi:hypothetical protein